MWARTVRRYLLAALGAAVFAAVYEAFSHGVISGWMVCLPLWPLLLGALPFAVLRGWSEWSRALWHAAVATLTAGRLVRGVLAIYGTTNEATAVFSIAGSVLMAASVFLWKR